MFQAFSLGRFSNVEKLELYTCEFRSNHKLMVFMLGFRRKAFFFFPKENERTHEGEHSYLHHFFPSFLPNLSSSTFCIVCYHYKSYFLPVTGLQGKLFDVGYVERSSQRAAKADRFWEKVMLVKAQSLKLNSVCSTCSLLFSGSWQPFKVVTGTELMKTDKA